MRKVSIVIAICFVFALALSVMAQQQVDLDAVMKQVAPAWTSLQMNLDSGNAAGVATDAAKLETLFKDAQTFFTKSKMEQPAGWAKEIADASSSTAKAAKAGTVDKAAKASIGKCKQCHDVYRQKNQDGSFSLKAQ
jgi:hypothetical protein